jgi:hypothetical protein
MDNVKSLVEIEPAHLTATSAEEVKAELVKAREADDADARIHEIALEIAGRLLQGLAKGAEQIAGQLVEPGLEAQIIDANSELLIELLRKRMPQAIEEAIALIIEEDKEHRERYIEEQKQIAAA